MTPKQIANQIYDQYWSDVSRKPVSKQDPLPDIRPLIEQAIINAEEAKAKEITEECARLLDKQARGFQVLIDHAPTPIRAEDLKRVKYSIEHVAELIRARSGEKRNPCIMLGCEGYAIDPDNFGRYCADHMPGAKKGD